MTMLATQSGSRRLYVPSRGAYATASLVEMVFENEGTRRTHKEGLRLLEAQQQIYVEGESRAAA